MAHERAQVVAESHEEAGTRLTLTGSAEVIAAFAELVDKAGA
jgi:hypothetical protein